jgi:hypothetical protein
MKAGVDDQQNEEKKPFVLPEDSEEETQPAFSILKEEETPSAY